VTQNERIYISTNFLHSLQQAPTPHNKNSFCLYRND